MLKYTVLICNSNLYENLLKNFPHFALNLGLCTSPQVIHCHPKPNILVTIFLAQIGREFLQSYTETKKEIPINMTTEKCLHMAQKCAEFKDKLLIHTTELIEEKLCIFNSLTHVFPFHNSPPE